MERFKVCEKEMKTKAFSKEGLGQAAKLDPREKARNEMRDWINETVDKLTAEVRHTDGCSANPTTELMLHALHISCTHVCVQRHAGFVGRAPLALMSLP